MKVISAARCTGAAFSATVTVRECSPASPAACERTIHSTPSVISACHGPEAENARSISPPAAGRVRVCGVPSGNVMVSVACCVIKMVTAEVPHVKVISAARCTGAAFSATVTVRECSPASPAACERTIHSTPSVISACHGPEAENARSISLPAAGRVRACGVPSANMSESSSSSSSPVPFPLSSVAFCVILAWTSSFPQVIVMSAVRSELFSFGSSAMCME